MMRSPIWLFAIIFAGVLLTGCNDLLFYRRRRVNLHYKSGNIADFLRRWERAYCYMIVLDAENLVEAPALVKMARLMEREPR